MNLTPWVTKDHTTKELAQKIIETQFPELVPVSLHFLGKGWDNDVFIINDRYVFRFPRTDFAVNEITNEIKHLNAIAPHISLSISEPLFIGKPTDDYQRPFYGHEKVEGVPSNTKNFTTKDYKQIAQDLAFFLKELHALDQTWAEQHSVRETQKKINYKNRSQKMLAIIKPIKNLNVVPKNFDWNLIIEFIHSCKDLPFTNYPFVVVHGDMGARHLLVDKDNKLSGIIDWGAMHAGPNYIDLKIVYIFLPKEVRKYFFEIYGKISTDTKKLALFKGTFCSLWLAKYSTAINDTYIQQESVNGLINIEKELKTIL